MEYVQFEENDAWLLWSIPSTGANLEHIIHGYVFLARDVIPSYEKLAACITNSIKAGILTQPKDGRFSLKTEWYNKLHSLDAKYACTEYGLIEFEEYFVSEKWPVVENTEFVLNKNEYGKATKNADKYYRKLFDGRCSSVNILIEKIRSIFRNFGHTER